MMAIFIECIAAFFATLCFSIIFNISRTELVPCGILGMIAWFVYKVVLLFISSIVFANFLASLTISIIAVFLARKRKMPITIYILSGIMPLVPGAGMYNTMYHIIIQKLSKATLYLIETIQIAGAIAISIALVLSLTNKKRCLSKNK